MWIITVAVRGAVPRRGRANGRDADMHPVSPARNRAAQINDASLPDFFIFSPPLGNTPTPDGSFIFTR
jgi:hypothetical protein